jgi:hypothetical protein
MFFRMLHKVKELGFLLDPSSYKFFSYHHLSKGDDVYTYQPIYI